LAVLVVHPGQGWKLARGRDSVELVVASLGRAGIVPSDVDAIVISHLHGDHFGGLPLILLDATMRAGSRPLTVAGPAATRQRTAQALEVFGWTTARVDISEFLESRTIRQRLIRRTKRFWISPHYAAIAIQL
jgi:ribonuclease BN (tRNA processing enzyme)